MKHIQEQKLTEGIQHKLLIKLLGYNFKVEYKKGKENRVADALSRVQCSIRAFLSSTVVPAWITEVVKSYTNDPKCSALAAQLAVAPQGNPPYTLTNGVIRYKGKILVGSNTELRQSLLTAFHTSELGGHSGERASYNKLKILFTWPGMRQEVKDFVQQCPVCQLNKAHHFPSPGLL